MVERPIKKSERLAKATSEGGTEDDSGTPSSVERKPRRSLDGEPHSSPDDRKDKGQGKDRKDRVKGKGKGKGKGKERDEKPTPMNLALMRGPRPVKTKPLEEEIPEEEPYLEATEASASEEAIGEESVAEGPTAMTTEETPTES
jgi:hypothetical protein